MRNLSTRITRRLSVAGEGLSEGLNLELEVSHVENVVYKTPNRAIAS